MLYVVCLIYNKKISFPLGETSTVRGKYSCKICHYSSPLLGNLKRHMLTHSGERPFGCKLCDKRFNQKCSLQRHMLVHCNQDQRMFLL